MGNEWRIKQAEGCTQLNSAERRKLGDFRDGGEMEIIPKHSQNGGCEYYCYYKEQNCFIYYLRIQLTNRVHLAVITVTS